jgi:hypothetical protein
MRVGNPLWYQRKRGKEFPLHNNPTIESAATIYYVFRYTLLTFGRDFYTMVLIRAVRLDNRAEDGSTSSRGNQYSDILEVPYAGTESKMAVT